MELLFRQVDLTNNVKIVDEILSKPMDIEVASSTFQTLKEEHKANKTYKEWTSQCFEYVDENKKTILIYIMRFL